MAFRHQGRRRGYVLWRIVAGGKSIWDWRVSSERTPFGPWSVMATRIRGKLYRAMGEDVFGYFTADIDGSHASMSYRCEVCKSFSCNGCEAEVKRWKYSVISSRFG